MKTFKTTNKDLKVYEKEVFFWQEYFGLLDWEIVIDHKPIEDARGRMEAAITGKIATIFLSDTWHTKPTLIQIKQTAFHEICELLLCNLGYYAGEVASKGVVEEQTHYIIRTLENSVFKRHYKL